MIHGHPKLGLQTPSGVLTSAYMGIPHKAFPEAISFDFHSKNNGLR